MIEAELSTITAAGDVAAALDAARENQETVIGNGNDLAVVARRDDVALDTVDLERFLPNPRRQVGSVEALTADGFLGAFRQRTVDGSNATVYANPDACTLTAVLNDDEQETAGWRDHRVTFKPQPTPEWTHWIEGQGLKSQDAFAAVLEGGETDIVNPSATVMLELAETFHASTSAKFKQAGRRRDGRVQLVYEEEIDAQAGEGMVDIPDVFTVLLRPFYGATPVEVGCKLRYRLDRGDLTIGYTIHRPDEIRRASFDADVVGHVRAELAGFPVIDANPAGAR